jgi:polar amino acid transport system substrate-binding protein
MRRERLYLEIREVTLARRRDPWNLCWTMNRRQGQGMTGKISDDVIRELTPTGELRAAINLGNFLLVTGKSATGEPEGVAPDMARAVADRLGVPIRYVTYEKPSQLADAVTGDAWDIGLIGAEPQRAEHIAFSKAYAEIEATYLVPEGSPFQRPEEVDAPGVRIAVTARTAYGLWLDRNVNQATLAHSNDMETTFQQFVDEKMDALAGLRSKLIKEAERLPGSRVLDGKFSAVQQAIGTPIGRSAAASFLAGFVEEAKASGLVAELIARHGVTGLSVAAG